MSKITVVNYLGDQIIDILSRLEGVSVITGPQFRVCRNICSLFSSRYIYYIEKTINVDSCKLEYKSNKVTEVFLRQNIHDDSKIAGTRDRYYTLDSTLKFYPFSIDSLTELKMDNLIFYDYKNCDQEQLKLLVNHYNTTNILLCQEYRDLKDWYKSIPI